MQKKLLNISFTVVDPQDFHLRTKKQIGSLMETLMLVQVAIPIKANQSLVNGLVENHKRKINEKSEDKVFVRKVMANLNRYFMQHLVTEVIPGPSAIRMDLLLNIPNMGLNGGNI